MKKLLLLFFISGTYTFVIDQNRAHSYNSWFGTFAEATALIEAKSYDALDIIKGMEEALKSYIQMDPHSAFLTSKQCRDLHEKMSEEMFGIGVVLPGDKAKDDEYFTIIEVQPDSPAEKAGIKPGDKVCEIISGTEKLLVKGHDIDEIMNAIKGQKDTEVTLKVIRGTNNQDPLTIVVKRGLVKKEMAAAYHFPDYNMYYLLLTIFNEKSIKNVRMILEKAISSKSNGVIIDLRNNTGGLLESTLSILNLFLPKNADVVCIKNRDKQVVSSWKSDGKSLKGINQLPIIILVNNYTASASEILSGVLQEYRKQQNLFPVYIVGDETFGKGSVQEVIPLSNECALKLTTGLYYLAFDKEIQGKGVEPDFIIDTRTPPSETSKWLTSSYGKEKALKGSIKPQNSPLKEEEKKNEKDLPWKERRKALIGQDYLIQTGITLLNIYHIGLPLHKHNPNQALTYMKKNYAIDAKISCIDINLN